MAALALALTALVTGGGGAQSWGLGHAFSIADVTAMVVSRVEGAYCRGWGERLGVLFAQACVLYAFPLSFRIVP